MSDGRAQQPAPARAASATALGVAGLRAAHLLLDDPPPILNDTVALRLLGDGAEARIRARADELQAPAARGLRTHVVVRSRYAEDRLHDAVARGVRQLVVLGAGLDTFAFRQPAWAAPLRIVEVDHPASQADKRARLADAGIAVPPNVVFAPVDFERDTLAEGLARAGFDAEAPAFFSWLGVTVYLDEAAIDAVLAFVAALPAGTEIVFSFAGPEGDSPSKLAERVAALGEPWRSRFHPDEILAKLRKAGFREAAVPSAGELAEAYLAGRSDGLPPPRRERLARAVV